MSRPLIIRPRADREFNRSVDLYEQRKTGLGLELREHLRTILRAIREQPDRFPLETRTTRKATIVKFHFDVYYRVTKDDEILVVSIYHQSRRPGGWKGRR